MLNKMYFQLLLYIILLGLIYLAFNYLSPKDNQITSFEECVSSGNKITMSYPRQCILENGQTFTESVYGNNKLYDNCATANIPDVQVDTVLNSESNFVEVRWSDPNTSENQLIILPYDPLGVYKNCSPSARRVLNNIETSNDQIVSVIQNSLIKQMNISKDRLEVISVKKTIFSNSCFEDAKPDEICAMVSTPGYEFLVKIDKAIYIYRSNVDGSIIRLIKSL